MKLLLDTHTFIWWTISVARLSSQALSLLQDRQNALFLSLASLWEMQLKIQLGKLHFNSPLSQIVEEQQRINGLKLLSIAPEHIYALDQLPFHHKDPFDRLLIAQAMTETIPVVSADAAFAAYPAQIIW
jgi:PIN domain nuclease of toxin-antitoxin system